MYYIGQDNDRDWKAGKFCDNCWLLYQYKCKEDFCRRCGIFGQMEEVCFRKTNNGIIELRMKRNLSQDRYHYTEGKGLTNGN